MLFFGYKLVFLFIGPSLISLICVKSLLNPLAQAVNTYCEPYLMRAIKLTSVSYPLLISLQEYTMTMYFRQKWVDERLKFDPVSASTDKILLSEKNLRQIWTPDTFFRNEKAASFHMVTVPNRLMKVSSDGSIWYVTK